MLIDKTVRELEMGHKVKGPKATKMCDLAMMQWDDHRKVHQVTSITANLAYLDKQVTNIAALQRASFLMQA